MVPDAAEPHPDPVAGKVVPTASGTEVVPALPDLPQAPSNIAATVAIRSQVKAIGRPRRP